MKCGCQWMNRTCAASHHARKRNVHFPAWLLLSCGLYTMLQKKRTVLLPFCFFSVTLCTLWFALPYSIRLPMFGRAECMNYHPRVPKASGAAETPNLFAAFGKAMGSIADSLVDVTMSVGNEMANVRAHHPSLPYLSFPLPLNCLTYSLWFTALIYLRLQPLLPDGLPSFISKKTSLRTRAHLTRTLPPLPDEACLICAFFLKASTDLLLWPTAFSLILLNFMVRWANPKPSSISMCVLLKCALRDCLTPR